MIRFIKHWWRQFRRRKKIARVIVVDSMTLVPSELNSNLYLVQRDGFDKRAVLGCPCGCERRIDLNLIPTQEPCWSIQLKRGQATVMPSVWLTADACRSHFFIRKNKVQWVNRA